MNKSNNIFEIIVGSLVLICALTFLINSLNNSSIKSAKKGYNISARFDNADGINQGSDVKISGVKIGNVVSQELDTETFQAILVINIDSKIKLPYDSSIKISSEGLLGSKYLSINAGSQEEYLEDGDEIEFTQSSVNLEDLLGKFIFNSKEKNENNQ